MHDVFFRFDFELTAERNPRGTMARFREELRAWFVARGLDYSMGALGGDRHCYGGVGPNPPATEADRQALAEWVRGQRVCATVRFGAVEQSYPPADMLAPITDWVFAVDNLTDADRAEAAAYHSEMRRRVEALRRKQP
jgi:hypothetical protein